MKDTIRVFLAARDEALATFADEHGDILDYAGYDEAKADWGEAAIDLLRSLTEEDV